MRYIPRFSTDIELVQVHSAPTAFFSSAGTQPPNTYILHTTRKEKLQDLHIFACKPSQYVRISKPTLNTLVISLNKKTPKNRTLMPNMVEQWKQNKTKYAKQGKCMTSGVRMRKLYYWFPITFEECWLLGEGQGPAVLGNDQVIVSEREINIIRVTNKGWINM